MTRYERAGGPANLTAAGADARDSRQP